VWKWQPGQPRGAGRDVALLARLPACHRALRLLSDALAAVAALPPWLVVRVAWARRLVRPRGAWLMGMCALAPAVLTCGMFTSSIAGWNRTGWRASTARMTATEPAAPAT